MENYLALLLSLGAINFLVAVGYLIARSRKFDFPFWLYVVTVLLCFWAVAIYPVIFYVERRIASRQAEYCKELHRRKIILGWLVLLSSCLVQGFMTFLVRFSPDYYNLSELPEICAMFTSLITVVIMFTAIGFMEKKR